MHIGMPGFLLAERPGEPGNSLPNWENQRSVKRINKSAEESIFRSIAQRVVECMKNKYRSSARQPRLCQVCKAKNNHVRAVGRCGPAASSY